MKANLTRLIVCWERDSDGLVNGLIKACNISPRRHSAWNMMRSDGLKSESSSLQRSAVILRSLIAIGISCASLGFRRPWIRCVIGAFGLRSENALFSDQSTSVHRSNHKASRFLLIMTLLTRIPSRVHSNLHIPIDEWSKLIDSWIWMQKPYAWSCACSQDLVFRLQSLSTDSIPPNHQDVEREDCLATSRAPCNVDKALIDVLGRHPML